MATVRYLVKDVDAAIAFYSVLGFVLADRWGPPFAVMKLGDLTLWVSGTHCVPPLGAQEMVRPAPAIDGVAGRSTGG